MQYSFELGWGVRGRLVALCKLQSDVIMDGDGTAVFVIDSFNSYSIVSSRLVPYSDGIYLFS